MPFVTEELWTIKGEDGPPRAGRLALGPASRGQTVFDRASGEECEIGWIVELVSEIRSVRLEVYVPDGCAHSTPDSGAGELFDRADRSKAWGDTIKPSCAHIDPARICGNSARRLAADRRARRPGALPLAGIVDIDSRKRRALDARNQQREWQEIAKVDAKLANPDFVARASSEIIADAPERREACFPIARDGRPRGRASRTDLMLRRPRVVTSVAIAQQLD